MAGKNSALQMLFGGGKASSRAPVSRPLFRGGTPADEDVRSKGSRAQPLADGGEVDSEDVDVSDELCVAAEDIMDLLGGGNFNADKPREEDSKIERASKSASRRAKAKVLAQALKAFSLIAESEPHDEG